MSDKEILEKIRIEIKYEVREWPWPYTWTLHDLNPTYGGDGWTGDLGVAMTLRGAKREAQRRVNKNRRDRERSNTVAIFEVPR